METEKDKKKQSRVKFRMILGVTALIILLMLWLTIAEILSS